MKNQVNVMISQEIWHNRMGHPSSEVLTTLLKSLGINSAINNDACGVCEACLRAKQSRVQFIPSRNKANELFDLVHCDIWGPYRVPFLCDAHYFLAIVDDASRGVWVYLM